jgi:hypothetical protein
MPYIFKIHRFFLSQRSIVSSDMPDLSECKGHSDGTAFQRHGTILDVSFTVRCAWPINIAWKPDIILILEKRKTKEGYVDLIVPS